MEEDIRETRNTLLDFGIGNKEDRERYAYLRVSNIKTPKDIRIAYEIFNHAMENVNDNESTKEYAKRMSKKYDAMVDDNDSKLYNNAHDPIIIFKANEVLKSIGGHNLTVDEITKNYEYVESELKKQGIEIKV